jgi:hypothetical protein
MPKSSFITLVEKKIKRHTFARKQSHSSFNTGLESVDANYDVIMKADADLIFLNYLKLSTSIFNQMFALVWQVDCYKKWRMDS